MWRMSARCTCWTSSDPWGRLSACGGLSSPLLSGSSATAINLRNQFHIPKAFFARRHRLLVSENALGEVIGLGNELIRIAGGTKFIDGRLAVNLRAKMHAIVVEHGLPEHLSPRPMHLEESHHWRAIR